MGTGSWKPFFTPPTYIYSWRFRQNCCFRQTTHRLFPRAPNAIYHISNRSFYFHVMFFVNADCKIVPDRIARKGDDLYIISLQNRTQAHKPLHHHFDVNCFSYSWTMLINQDTVSLENIVPHFRVENIFSLLLFIFSYWRNYEYMNFALFPIRL